MKKASKNVCVMDIETDGLDPTLIHCISYTKYIDGEWVTQPTATTYEDMREVVSEMDIIIGHNFVQYDVPAIEKILGVKLKVKIYDTIALSRYLYPDLLKHGLEIWGEYFGIPKPKIDDWKTLPLEEYVIRCEEDVKINLQLWIKIWNYLIKIYGEASKAKDLIDYLELNMDILRIQAVNKWKIDSEKCKVGIAELSIIKEEKVEELKTIMPMVKTFRKFYKPAVGRYKLTPKQISEGVLQGDLNVSGVKWNGYIEDGLKVLYDAKKEDRAYVELKGVPREPNPNSTDQMKNYLYSLGWKPETIKIVKNKKKPDEKPREIPQIRIEIAGEKVLCRSIKRLFKVEPKLEALDGVTVLTHRIGVLNGFLNGADDSDLIIAGAGGLARTLRLTHKKPYCNLPKVKKPYGKLIRSCLIAREGNILVNSDLRSLEDRTKQERMMDYDPEYVARMSAKDYDPHLETCIAGGLLTREQVDDHKSGKEDYSSERDIGKTSNYLLTYGGGAKALAKAAELPLSKAKSMHKGYWELNKSVKQIAKAVVTKNVDGVTWAFNDVSNFWYALNGEHNMFSLINQSTGSFLFVKWMELVINHDMQKEGYMLVSQYHDEQNWEIPDTEEDKNKIKKIMTNSIAKINKLHKFRVKLDISVSFGYNLSEVH